MTPSPLLTIQEMRSKRYLPFSPTTIYAMCNLATDALPHHKIGSRYYFIVEEVAEWIDRHTIRGLNDRARVEKLTRKETLAVKEACGRGEAA